MCLIVQKSFQNSNWRKWSQSDRRNYRNWTMGATSTTRDPDQLAAGRVWITGLSVVMIARSIRSGFLNIFQLYLHCVSYNVFIFNDHLSAAKINRNSGARFTKDLKIYLKFVMRNIVTSDLRCRKIILRSS